MINTTTIKNQSTDKIRRTELSNFLRIRRERLNPEHFKIPVSPRRRTPGLRREELAQLAGVSVSWYTWLEQGRPITVSDQVLESISRVLQLNWAERRHLFLLAKDHLPPSSLSSEDMHCISPQLQQVLDAFGICPAYMLDKFWNIVAWNKSAAKVFSDYTTLSSRDKNLIWLLFTHPSQKKLIVDWENEARRCIAQFRFSIDQYIGEPWLTELINDLNYVSSDFRNWWTKYDIQAAHGKCKRLNHPQAGSLALHATTLLLPDYNEFKIIVYTPLPEEGTADKLAKLVEIR
ncbi:helix-turn-helix protein [Anaerobacterium chartisolvens]|uniref:Helix-turn-helix protein n=1 Tax=Anaerobacterium chartisolvens TaxID=1297424 RepID=A0A369AYW3_9FIRM|nr:helix-turn-helix transcriptional regulator [Anaerobacterium chartisolvens]RCX14341.1 helix-turn-helix protein [Anaerobacterium chartisolvens]